MGKKRKAGRLGASVPKTGPNEEVISTAARYDQDKTFTDSQDEFFASKDQIMLEEGPSRKRWRQIEEQDRYLEPSDEEVLGFNEDDDDDDDDDVTDNESKSSNQDQSNSEPEEGVQGWGVSTADYYDADVIETEADALEEEAEAKRLQQMHLQKITEADYGLDDAEWVKTEDEQYAARGTVFEKLPDVQITEDTPVVERLKMLKSRYPELEQLARDYAGLQIIFDELKAVAKNEMISRKQSTKKRKAGQDKPSSPVSIGVLKWRSLSTYMGSIAMYCALLTAPAAGKLGAIAPTPPTELQQHPVMQTLLRARQSWDSIKDLEAPETRELEEGSTAGLKKAPSKTQSIEMLTSVPGPPPLLDELKCEEKPKNSTKLQDDDKESAKEVIQGRKGAKRGGVLDELDNLIANVKNNSRAQAETFFSDAEESDFGDEVALTAQEAAEKAQRKKGLRFYTSQLAQKSNKRAAASHQAGGDADLPYKERIKDRQARLMREAEKRGGEKAQLEQRLDYQDEDEDEDEEEIARASKQIQGDASDSEDYYQTIYSKSKLKKAEKTTRAAAHAEAGKGGRLIYVEDIVGEDGKRGITYEISKNKGLMPRRKKEVRNPRVKKRMKYDERVKKLGSIRQVYKGGEGKGGYGGELSGIKTNIVRSVKL